MDRLDSARQGAAGRKPRWPRFGPLAATLMVAAALVPRLPDLGALSFWFDEVQAMKIARAATPAEVLERLGQIDRSSAPLHPLALHAWTGLFGTSEAAARSLSVLCSAIAVGIVGWIARMAFDDRAAWAASALALVNPVDVHYAREARMYAMLVLGTCLAWAMLFSFRRGAPPGRVAAYAIVLAAMLYTHPLAAFLIVALGLAYLCDLPLSQLRPRAWLASQLGALLAVIPWIPHYLGPGTPGKKPPLTLEGYTGWLREFTGGPWWLVLVALGLCAWAARRAVRSRFEAEARALAMVAIWLVVPPVLLFVYSTIKTPLFGPIRYVLACGPAYLLLLAYALTRLPRSAAAAAIAGVVFLAATTIPLRAYAPTLKADWRWAAATIHRLDPAAPVVLGHGESHMARTVLPYYLGDTPPTVPAARARDLDTASLWYAYDRFDPTVSLPRDLAARYRLERTERRAQVVLEHWVAARTLTAATPTSQAAVRQ